MYSRLSERELLRLALHRGQVRNRREHHSPRQRRAKAGLDLSLVKRQREAALQRHLVRAELLHQRAELARMVGLQRLWIGRDRPRFGQRVLSRVTAQQVGHCRVAPVDFLNRLREPLVDRPVHQSVGEQKHGDHRPKREHQCAQHHLAPEARACRPGLPLQVELQQRAQQHENQRHQRHENQRR